MADVHVLEGRTAIVTGAGQGMGEAIARALAHEGAAVVVGDLDAARAAQAAAAIRGAGGRALAIRADVSEEAGAEAMARAAVDAFGGLDILVNNAGVAAVKPFMQTTRADLERMMRVNVTGAMLCAQAALRVMLPRGYGRIINVSSISGQRGGTGRTAYGASKAALELMTRVMAVELAADGITVNAVAPGAIETAMAAGLHDLATRRAYGVQTPARRYGTPDEVAAAVVFLASEAAGYVCGHVLNIDGGFVAAGLMPRADQ